MTTAEPIRSRFWIRALWGLILFSLVVRLVLVGLGGQYFFGDEKRYDRGIEFYQSVVSGRTDRIRFALLYPEHEGFMLFGSVITALQHVAAQLTPYRDWSHPENILFTMKFAAGFLSLFSVANIGLLYALSRRLGALPREAFFCAALLAFSNSGFYYSRHLLPYDTALTLMLLSLLAAAHAGKHSFRCGLVAGIWCGAMFHIYNAFWFVVLVLAAVQFYLAYVRGDWPKRMMGFGVGAGTVFALPIAVGCFIGGDVYLKLMAGFGRSAFLGLFSEGATFPWEYLAHAEAGYGAVVLALIGWALWTQLREKSSWPIRLIVFFSALGLAYALLVLFSVGLEKIVVYARTVKPLVVLACGVGGWSLNLFFERRRSLAQGVLPVLILLGLVNWIPHFTFSFPVETENFVMGTIGNPKRALSFSGSLYWDVPLPVTRPDLMLVNAQMLYPLRQVEPLPAGKIILSFEHPLTYKPFQYECHSPRERAMLRAFPPRILLIQLEQSNLYPDAPSAEMQFTKADIPTGHR